MSNFLTANRLRFLFLALIAANSIRLIGGTQRTLATIAGKLDGFHYLPGIGDMMAGAAAIGLVIALARRPLDALTRRLLWGWNLFGAVDLMIAMPVNVVFRPADPRFFTPGLATTFLLCHFAMIGLLWVSRSTNPAVSR